VDRFEATGDPWGQMMARGALIRALVCLGRVDDALDLLEQGGGVFGGAMTRLTAAHVQIHLGAPDALATALHVGSNEGGGTEALATAHLVLGLALLQDGRVAEAVDEIEAARAIGRPELTGSAPAICGALSLAYAAAGRGDEAIALAEAGIGQGTYLDDLHHRLGGAFGRVRAGDPDAPAAFDAAVAACDATSSRLDQAVVRLARAHALAALDHPDAEAAGRDATARLEAMGISAPGWARAFSLAAGA
jgi:hypothetical protein